MLSNFDYAFSLVLQSEGGYANDPVDRGGETNLGVTRSSWSFYLCRPIEDGEMMALTREIVKPFYKKMYWDKLHCDDLPSGVDYAAFEFAVNAGNSAAAKLIQRSVGAPADGVMGTTTLLCLKGIAPDVLLNSFTEKKEAFYRGLAEHNPSQAKFLTGWLNRTARVQVKAAAMTV